MKRILPVSALLLLAACAESPSAPQTSFEPQASVAVGTTGTWHFEGINYSYTSDPNGPVSGSVSFTLTEPEDPFMPKFQRGTVAFEFTTNGQHFEMSAVAPFGYVYTDLSIPRLQIVTQNTTGQYMSLWVDPLPPMEIGPAPPAEFSIAILDWSGGQIHISKLWSAPVNPTTRQDCMKGGWQAFGFSNQGQCVRYVETGKDSR